MTVIDRLVREVAIVLMAAVVGIGVACTSSGPGRAEDQLEGLRAEIRKTIGDGARADEMLAAVDRMEASLEELGELVSKHGDELRVMVRDYDTTRSEIGAAFERFLQERRTIALRLADAHYELKALTKPAEWKRLAKKEKMALAWAAQRNLGEVPVLEGGS